MTNLIGEAVALVLVGALVGGCGGAVASGPSDAGHRDGTATSSSSSSVTSTSVSVTSTSSTFVESTSVSSTRVSSSTDISPGTSGSTGTVNTSTSGDASLCYAAPTVLFPEDGGVGVYCPFSAPDGGKDINCAKGSQCCVPPESANMPSTCEPGANACTVKDSVDVFCEGTPDCSGNAGKLCCGQGVIAMQAAQPGCAPDGGTIPPYPYVSGFYGSACQTSCAAFGDAGGASFQICSKQSECSAGSTCIPIRPKGNSLGYCSGP